MNIKWVPIYHEKHGGIVWWVDERWLAEAKESKAPKPQIKDQRAGGT